MKSVRYSTKAKKDLKRYRNDAHKMRCCMKSWTFCKGRNR